MSHVARPDHDPRHPVQITMRANNSPNLRSASTFSAVRRSIARAHKPQFHIIHFSVQQDHLHLIVEAGDRISLRNGVRGLAIRIALAVNRVAKRRGSLFIDRFHSRALRTPMAGFSGRTFAATLVRFAQLEAGWVQRVGGDADSSTVAKVRAADLDSADVV